MAEVQTDGEIVWLTQAQLAELFGKRQGMNKKNKTIEVLSTEVKVKTIEQNDFICLTDIAKSKNPEHPDDLIRSWLRNRNTLELLGIWEQLYNPVFKPVEFDGFKK